jgi:hypothetical protein
MLMLLVRTEGVQTLDPENSYDGAENVGLFEVDVD